MAEVEPNQPQAPSREGPLPPDPDAYDSPRAVQARARGLAAPYIPGGEDPDPEGTRRRERRYLKWLIAMVVVVVLAGFVLGIVAKLLGIDALGAARPQASAQGLAPVGLMTTAAPPTGSPSITAPPSAPPVLGALEDGVPTTLDGIDVVHDGAVLHASKRSTDATPFLIGGWFHSLANARFCTLFSPPRPVDSCHWGIDLFIASNTKLGLTLAAGTDGKAAIDIAETTVRPVVLRVHTHDPLCVGEFRYCRATLVLDKIAWLGTTMALLPPAAAETPPPTTFSRHDALAKARRQLGSTYDLRSIKVVRDTTAEGILLGPVSEDRWVWWLKFRISGTRSTAVFIYDYLTGKELMRSYGSGS